jgi:type II secretory pathway component PulM
MLKQRWIEASARERLLVLVMAAVVFSAVLVALLVRPAWRVVRSAPATLAALDAKMLNMRAQAAQLRSATAAATAPVAASPLQSTERELKGPGATVAAARDGASAAQGATTISLSNVEGARLAAWLAAAEVQRQLLRLNLTRDPTTGRVSGTAVLRTPAQ